VSTIEPSRPSIDAPDPPPKGFRAGAEVVGLSPWKTALVLFGVAALLGVIDFLLTLFVFPMRRDPNPALVAAVTFPAWLVLPPLVPLVLFVAERFPLGTGRWGRSLLVHIPACILWVLLYEVLASWLCDFVFAPMVVPPAELPATFHDFWTNLRRLLATYFVGWSAVYGLIVGVHHTFFYMRRALQRDREAAGLALKALRLEAGLAQANLHALNMQLQPHFLFNTLNAVSVLAAKGERVETVRLIGRLSELLRMSLGNTAQSVTLSRELEFVQRYLDIEQVRFQDRLSVRFDVAPDTLGAQVPSMILQPLVENSIKHGVSRRRGAARLEVRSRRTADTLELAVRDDGPGFGASPARGNGVGLANTVARLEQLYGPDGFELDRGDAPGGGALVRVTLPFRTAPDDAGSPAVPVIALEAV
jgi:two-component system LytT family sensor kinase